jgi:hypothetical protein
VLEVRADKTERLTPTSLFYLINPINRLLAHQITADSVIRIRWIGDDTLTVKYVNHLSDFPHLGVCGIDIDKHDACFKNLTF